MPPLLTGLIASLLLVANTLFWSPLLILFALLKLILPIPALRKPLSWLVDSCANAWISGNSGWMLLTQKMEWQIRRPQPLSNDQWYFVVSNHQSWVDILVLQHVLNRRVPLLKFFLKQELIWVPIMGIVWWGLDFPFMKRYSKAYLQKHPEKRGQDLATTRKACEKFQTRPTSVMNFLEGTRFTRAKHEHQQSPFQHLLTPRAGGMAYALSVMGGRFNALLDVTIFYPDGTPTFWDFLQGKMPRCQVIVDEKAIPQDLLEGDYQNDPDYRARFQQWVQELWRHKDQLLEQMQDNT
jgi:1-acyl-sn-glycerol-3-phosphate acyltransferase